MWRGEWEHRRRFDAQRSLVDDDGELRSYRQMRALRREHKALLARPNRDNLRNFDESPPFVSLTEVAADPAFRKMYDRLSNLEADTEHAVFGCSRGVALALQFESYRRRNDYQPIDPALQPLDQGIFPYIPIPFVAFGMANEDDATLLWLLRAIPYLCWSKWNGESRKQYITFHNLSREAWIECDEGVLSAPALAALAYANKNVGTLLANVHLIADYSPVSLSMTDIRVLKYASEVPAAVIEEACRIGDSLDGVLAVVFNVGSLTERAVDDIRIEQQLGVTAMERGKPIGVRNHSQEFINFTSRLKETGVNRIDLRYYTEMLGKGIFDGTIIADHFLAGIDLDLVQW